MRLSNALSVNERCVTDDGFNCRSRCKDERTEGLADKLQGRFDMSSLHLNIQLQIIQLQIIQLQIIQLQIIQLQIIQFQIIQLQIIQCSIPVV